MYTQFACGKSQHDRKKHPRIERHVGHTEEEVQRVHDHGQHPPCHIQTDEVTLPAFRGCGGRVDQANGFLGNVSFSDSRKTLSNLSVEVGSTPSQEVIHDRQGEECDAADGELPDF